MRKTSWLIATLGIMAGLLLSANMVLRRPLDVPSSERLDALVQMGALSEPALGGLRQYSEHCAGCHGVAAEGTPDGPGLLGRAYAVDFRHSRMLHGALGQDITAHWQANLQNTGTGTQGFNRLEKIAKLLREIRRANRN